MRTPPRQVGRLPSVLLARSALSSLVVVGCLAALPSRGYATSDGRAVQPEPQQPPATRPTLRPSPTSRPPVIDGILDDEVWRGAPLQTGEWLSYNPLHGDRIAQRTKVWIAYDDDYLYFAFQCDDPDPAGIKTSITRRDNIWSDDWIGLSLDSLGSGQSAYHLLVNPNGVQLDMLNSVAGGEDQSPDYVWDSAARLNQSGYAAEIRLPLQTIRFRGGHDVRMGILFWRRISRTGISVAWPPLEPGKWVFEKHASLIFDELRPRLPREAIPSFTYARNQARETPFRWAGADDRGEVGLSAKYGITSTITLDATVNPDFSQVESDAFQVEVNQRFPIFFSEKRPFFMEGAGLFTLAAEGNDSSLQRAVHTRRIVDPVFGAKVTGSTGRLTFGTLTALDQGPGRALPAGHPDTGKDRLFNVLRGQYSLGPSNYVGGLLVESHFAGGYNRVLGADLSWRVGSAQRVSGLLLGSWSREPRAAESTGAFAAQGVYEYSSRRLVLAGSGEHFDRHFQMQTAFVNRVGITSGWGFAEYSFYPDESRYPWIRRISPFSFTQGGRDRGAGGNDLVQVLGLRMRFTRQGSLRIDRFEGFETWNSQRFARGAWRAQGDVQLYRWLSLSGRHLGGKAVFYDPANPFLGRIRDARVGVNLQPTGRFSQNMSYRRVAFDRESTGERVYDLDILFSRTTYQFSRQFFLRGIVQFDTSRYRVLTDFLASYELRPGTVVYAGYGALLERRSFAEGEWQLGEGDYRASQRGVFFKASYLHRF